MEDEEEEIPASKTLAASEVSHTHNSQFQNLGTLASKICLQNLGLTTANCSSILPADAFKYMIYF